MTSLDDDALMRIAIDASRAARGVSTPNPPVGAVVVDADGEIAGVGSTSPAGGPHAEINALREAGERARGGTAVVTLEPCNHTGRTGPCSEALIDAGIARVVFAVADPNPRAAGGAQRLAAAGVRVSHGVGTADAERGPLREWLFRQAHGRPHVTAKYAATLDGRIAAPDGTSQWITGPVARARVHEIRGELDAIVVGTGTVERDDPALTARHPDGSLRGHQPTRIILGDRDIRPDAQIFSDAAATIHVRGHDPRDALAAAGDALAVQVEGGPRVIGAFLAADLVDALQVYLAPTVLGAGAAAVDDPTVTTLAQAHHFVLEGSQVLGDDIALTLIRAR